MSSQETRLKRPAQVKADTMPLWVGLGVLGLILALVSVVEYFSSFGADRIQSISQSYFTEARDVFVGVLCTIGFCFFYYTGFPNEVERKSSGYLWDRLSDRGVSIAAGIGALLVAFAPHENPAKFKPDLTFAPNTLFGVPIAWFHLTGALLLFVMMALFCLFLFTRGNGTEKNWEATGRKNKYGVAKMVWSRRNTLFILLGLTILGCIGWIVAVFKNGPIFWPEWIAVTAFCVAWITKSRPIRVTKAATGAKPYASYGEDGAD